MKATSVSGPLVEAYSELFAYICHVRQDLRASPPAADEVRARVQNLLSKGDQTAQEMGIASSEIAPARFAMCAWIDELFMNVSWPGRDLWQRSLLQTEYFQTTKAGEEFFSYLNALQPGQAAVREIYYICLSLGFKGRYCKPGDEAVISQMRDAQLAALRGQEQLDLRDPAPVFRDGYPSEAESESMLLGRGSFGMDRGHIVLAVGPAAFFLILFLIYTFVSRGVAQDILGPILGLGG